MKVLISDANVLIDMEVGGLIELMFKLPFEFQTPDILFEEELAEDHAYFLGLGLIKAPLSSAMLLRAEELIVKYPVPSRNDIFGLVLAEALNVPLLTGDDKLRSATKKEAVQLNGTVWLLGQLRQQELASKEVLEIAVAKMRAGNRWLPWATIDRLVKSW